MLTELDDEIRVVEQRIERGRHGLAALAADYGETARDAISSPQSLLAVATLGFFLGEAFRPLHRNPANKRFGLAGLLAGAAMSFVRARYGSPWAFVQTAWSRAAADRQRRALDSDSVRQF
jgi:hypothetical protein